MAIADIRTLAPIVPYTRKGGTGQGTSPLIAPFGTAATPSAPITVRVGDILVNSSGKAVVDNTVPTATTIMGVAVETKVFTSNTVDDYITYAPAFPGALFLGSMIGAADTDLTPTDHSLLFAGTTSAYDINTFTGGTFPVILSGATTADNAIVVGFAREQIRGLNFKLSSTVNPRVLFTFQTSIWHALMA